jgi:hypothetical protein
MDGRSARSDAPKCRWKTRSGYNSWLLQPDEVGRATPVNKRMPTYQSAACGKSRNRTKYADAFAGDTQLRALCSAQAGQLANIYCSNVASHMSCALGNVLNLLVGQFHSVDPEIAAGD